MFRMFRKIFTVIFFTALLFNAVESNAKNKSILDPEGADWLTACALADDHRSGTNKAGDVACCSSSLGYCVLCRVGKKCVKSPTSSILPGGIRPQLPRSPIGIMAPVPSSPNNKFKPKKVNPTIENKLQYNK